MAEPDYRGRAAAGITALQRWYRPQTGLWVGTGWWNSANALIFARNTAAWDDSCGGSLRWHAKSTYKNAITNELFFTLAALLHQRSPGGSYLSWAQRGWEWFSSRRFISQAGLVNDGITRDCQNNGGTTWTCNQGVILGGLAALSEITGDRGYLTKGEAIAAAAIRGLAPGGILTEPCESGAVCNEDQAQFKGIFIRYLYEFWRHSRQPGYRGFILANANSVWDHARDHSSQPASPQPAPPHFGLHWAGPFDRATPARQSSALDLLTSAAALAP